MEKFTPIYWPMCSRDKASPIGKENVSEEELL